MDTNANRSIASGSVYWIIIYDIDLFFIVKFLVYHIAYAIINYIRGIFMDPNNYYISNVTDLGDGNYTSNLTDNQLASRVQQISAWKNTHLGMGTVIQEFNGQFTTILDTPKLDEEITSLENKFASLQAKIETIAPFGKETVGPKKAAACEYLEGIKEKVNARKSATIARRNARKQAWLTKYTYMVEATTVYGIILTDRNLG